MKKIYFILLITLGFAKQTYGQGKPFFREFPKLNREVNQSIYDLYVDDKGLLYLGTSLGLFSFNGLEVKTFQFSNNLSFSVDNIQQSSDGKIWCKNFSNEIFYLQNNILQKDKILEEYIKSIDAYLLDFIFVGETMYLLLENSFIKYDLIQNKITEVLNLEPGEEVFHAVNYNKTTSEIILGSDLNLYTIKNEKVVDKAKLKKGTKSVHVYLNELFLINNKTKEVLRRNQPIHTQKEDSIKTIFYRFSELNSELWLSSSSGLFKFNDNSNSIESFGLSHNNVTDIVMDLEGNYWISTLDSGVFFLPNINLKLLGNNEGKETSIPQSYSTLTSNLKNEFYAGTSNGRIMKFDLNNNLAFILDTKTNLEIEYLFEDNQKLITSRGFFDLDNSNKFIESYIGKSIAKDNLGNYLISTYNLAGIMNIDFSGSPEVFKNNLIDFGNLNAKISVLRNKRSRSCYFSKTSKNYYIGYSDGLFFYDGKLTQNELRHNDKEIIAVSILEDEKENLWIATNRNGVLVSRNNKIIDSITTIDGLSNNKTKSIKIDNDKVWILTETNLDFYDLNHKKVINIGNRLGLNGLILNDILILNDYLYIATNKGILYIKLTDLEDPILPYFDVSVLDSNYKTSETSVFEYNENINIQFNPIYYKSFGDFNYSYILKPIQKQWQNQKAQNSELNFFSLPPGKYELIAKIDDQNIISREKRVEFEIIKPFWQKWWFTSLMSLFFITIIILIYKFAVYKTQKRQNLKEELATSQLTALRSQMNPHFIFNVLNSIQGLMYSNQKGKANDYMGKFSELMRNILDNSEKRYISLEDEIHTMKLYVELEKSRFEEMDFKYSLLVDKELDPSEIEIPSMILQPFVENAIKHGLMHKRGQKLLEVNFKQKNPSILSVEIKDNGVGIKLASEINEKVKKHKSFATNAIDKRISLMNKLSESPISIKITDLATDKTHSQGTLITIDFPIRNK